MTFEDLFDRMDLEELRQESETLSDLLYKGVRLTENSAFEQLESLLGKLDELLIAAHEEGLWVDPDYPEDA